MTDNFTVARLPPIERKPGSPTGLCLTQAGNSTIPVHSSSLFKEDAVGRLETWPAHSSDRGLQGPSLHITRNKRLVVIDDHSSVAASSQLVPKPKFLQHLEDFLERELRCLKVAGNEPSDLRLQAYRQVFGYLIEDFKTYKPLLSAIKNEYEMMIALQREEIQRLQPLQQMLVAVAEQCEQKILSIREQEKQEVKDLKAENRRLYEKIDTLRNEQVELHHQVERLEEDLGSQYLKYRDEYDARKLLIADMNELRYQHEELLAAKSSAESQEGEKEDPVMLRIALKKAREDEASATRRLNEMVANYGDVIPRRDYEQLQKHYEIIEEKLETLSNDFKKLHAEHNTLLDVHKQILQQRDDYYIEAETLRRSATPRPNWNRCAAHVAGGVEHWKKATEGKTSDQIVDVLLGEIQGAGDEGRDTIQAEYFDGLGTGDDVPKYLRYEGKVRNRHVSKRDCLVYIHDIWRKKGLRDAESTDGRRYKMSDFMYDYLRQTFGLEEMAIEWAYNLQQSIQRFSNTDDRIQLFWNVLRGTADEELHHGFLERVSLLLSALAKADVEQTGMISKEDFTAVLTGFSLFRVKESEAILSLVQAAENELGCKEEEPMSYQNLFMQDSEGQTGPFLEELRKQTEQERMQFVQEIIDNFDSSALIAVDEFRTAILSIDPHIELESLDHCIEWVFADVEKPDQLAPSQDRDVIVSRLQLCSVHRTGPKP